jgi:hypothetical protein
MKLRPARSSLPSNRGVRSCACTRLKIPILARGDLSTRSVASKIEDELLVNDGYVLHKSPMVSVGNGSKMNLMVAHSKRWAVAVSGVADAPPIASREWVEAIVQADGVDEASICNEFGVVVEVFNTGSGVLPRALMGGTFTAGGSGVRIRVASTGDVPYGLPATYPSSLSSPLVAGLSTEFATLVLDGLVEGLHLNVLPAGDLVITVGAYDELNSSRLAFRRASELFLAVLRPAVRVMPQSDTIESIISEW